MHHKMEIEQSESVKQMSQCNKNNGGKGIK